MFNAYNISLALFVRYERFQMAKSHRTVGHYMMDCDEKVRNEI